MKIEYVDNLDQFNDRELYNLLRKVQERCWKIRNDDNRSDSDNKEYDWLLDYDDEIEAECKIRKIDTSKPFIEK